MNRWKPTQKQVWWGAGILLGLLGIAIGVGVWVWNDTPDFSAMRRSVEVTIRDANGQPATRRVGPAAPGWVPLDQVSNYALMAIVASEDTSFFQHEGVDFHEIKEAIKKDLKEKRFARGASTLTQQVIKNTFLSNEKTLWRKIREVLWASQMEAKLGKREILAFYVNLVEFGPGIYGIGRASQYYFSKSPSELDPREGAFLAMLLPSPRRYHEYFEKRELSDWANKRVNRILKIMHRMNFIGELEYRVGVERRLWPGQGEEPMAEGEVAPGDETPAEFPATLPDPGEAETETDGKDIQPSPDGEDADMESDEVETETPGSAESNLPPDSGVGEGAEPPAEP